MKWDVILAHKLEVTNVAGAFIFAPPSLPVTARSISPFLCRADILDRRIKPDVENLSFKTGTDLALVSHWNSPTQIPGNTAIIESFIQPLARDRGNKEGPVFF